MTTQPHAATMINYYAQESGFSGIPIWTVSQALNHNQSLWLIILFKKVYLVDANVNHFPSICILYDDACIIMQIAFIGGKIHQ